MCRLYVPTLAKGTNLNIFGMLFSLRFKIFPNKRWKQFNISWRENKKGFQTKALSPVVLGIVRCYYFYRVIRQSGYEKKTASPFSSCYKCFVLGVSMCNKLCDWTIKKNKQNWGRTRVLSLALPNITTGHKDKIAPSFSFSICFRLCKSVCPCVSSKEPREGGEVALQRHIHSLANQFAIRINSFNLHTAK